jgi:hypothetical protein
MNQENSKNLSIVFQKNHNKFVNFRNLRKQTPQMPNKVGNSNLKLSKPYPDVQRDLKII